MKVAIDVDALYRRAFGRLDDVGRYLDELRQLRAAKGNGKGLAASAQDPDEGPGPDDEDTEDEDEVTARCMPVEP
jgi:hypothetical protein